MTFEDLIPGKNDLGIIRYYLNFDNGYGISVITGSFTRSDINTYEVAILKNGHLYYGTPITDDVLSYQTKEDINNIIKKLESYSKDQY